jgi:hypothetical protein
MAANSSGKRDWLTFDGADYLITKIVLGIAVVGSIIFGLVGPIIDAATNAPLALSYKTKVASGIHLPRGTTHDGYATMQLLLHDATLGERIGQAIPELLVGAMTIGVAWLLFQLLRTTQAAEPFTVRNVRRINLIALTIGIGGMLVQLAHGFADNAIANADRLPDPTSLTFEMTFTPLPLVVMLVMAIVAEAFRRGIALRNDVEGLV